MQKINLNPPSGCRDFLPLDVRKRDYILSIIKETYEKYGYEPIETPVIERLEVLFGKTGEEQDKLIFKILKRGKKLEDALKQSEELKSEELSEYGLRFDLTVPLARFYANYNTRLPRVFKRYQMTQVWRAERSQRGRYREFYQCDIDVIGSSSPMIEVEIILATIDAFLNLGFDDFILNINDRRILYNLLESLQINKIDETFVIIDKLDKIGKKGVLKSLSELISEQKASELVGVFDSIDKSLPAFLAIKQIEEKIRDLNNENFDNAIYNNLRFICETIEKVGIKKGKLQFNPYMVRGMAYYTGPIFEITIPNVPFSLAGGGRYDELIGIYYKKDFPACGISIGFDRVFYLMDEKNMFPENLNTREILMTNFLEDLQVECFKLTENLRKSGFNVFLYPDFNDKLSKQLSFAGKNRFKFAVLYGKDELKKKSITIKDLELNKQETLSIDLAIDYLRQKLR